MADAAVTFLLHQLTEVLKGYHNLIADAKHEFNQLQDDLNLLKASLKDIEKNLKEIELFKEIGKQIRELVYDVEDVIDTCLTQAAAAKEKNLFSRYLQLNRINLAQQVKFVREQRVKPTMERFKTINFTMIQTVEEPGEKSIREDRLVNVKDEEKIIANYLMERREELDVVSIIGMPGLGKTTLVWKIYGSDQIKNEFPTRIWIDVSQRFHSTGDVKKDVFFYIREMPGKEGTSRPLSIQKLAEKVRPCLMKEKFLLVMDNVWSDDAWKAIKNVLPYDKGMGKVLITSRQKSVGVHANENRIHTLRFLTPEESWELLQLERFGNLKDCPPNLQGIGRYIARQCDGVPLVIEAIGAILKVQKNWDEVPKNVSQYLESDNAKSIIEAVAYSYNELPTDLRDCFLYIGMFPDHHKISARTLARLWIAEGFIRPDKKKSLEQIAHENLDALIDRNLLLVLETNHIDQVKICRVHDMIRAFCRFIAQDQNLFEEIEGRNEGELVPLPSGEQNYHRLCLHSGLDINTFLSAKRNGPSVRSFLYFHAKPVPVTLENLSAIPDAFKSLRVLDSKSIKFPKFPEDVAKLIHLRYITISIDVLDFLPEQISLLFNLQTLVVETMKDSFTMKANIWKMAQLRHVKTKAAIVLDDKKWKGAARENLKTLSRLSSKSCTEDVLRRARNLKSLGIRGDLAAHNNTISLAEMGSLEKLNLVNDSPFKSAKLHCFLQSECFPPHLKRLTLSNTCLNWGSHMPTLAMINELEVLKLKDNAFTGDSWKAVGYCFQNLKFLLIVKTNLVIWEASTDHFPSLKSLVLKDCKELQAIPGTLSKNLEKLYIYGLCKSAVDSARAIEAKKKRRKKERELNAGSNSSSSYVLDVNNNQLIKLKSNMLSDVTAKLTSGLWSHLVSA